MDIGMRSLHPAAADYSVSIRGSRCTTLIMLLLRSRAGDLAAQRWYSNCGDGTWRLPLLLQGMRVTYVTKTFTFSRHSESRRMTDKIGIPIKAPQELPLPAPYVGLCIRQTIGLATQIRSTTAVPRAYPNSRTWIVWKRHTAESPPPRGV